MNEVNFKSMLVQLLFLIFLLVGIYLTSFYNYLLFHSLAELVSILIFYSVFILAWNSRKISNNSYLQFIGISFLFIATIDLLHVLAYKGMGVFVNFDSNLPTQLWIMARYFQALAFLVAPMVIEKKINHKLLIFIYTVITTILLTSVFYIKIFPVAYIEGFGLTDFKIVSEYIISLILLSSIILLVKKRSSFDKTIFNFLIFSIVLTIFAELAFTSYIGVYDFSNLVGHLLKIVTAFLIYQALVKVGFEKPYSLLFWDLKKTKEEVVQLNGVLKLLNKTLRHDVLNDLTVAGGNIDLYLEYGEKKIDLDKTMKEVSEVIKRDISFINQMRELEQAITAGDKLKPIKVSKVIEKVRKQFKDMNITSSGNAIIMADEAFESVIINLVRNAKIHGKVNQVDIKVELHNGLVKIFVADNGKGIPSKIKKNLFTEGFKYGKTGQSGLGLFIVKKTIDRYQGNIWVEDNKPKGSIFILEIKEG